MSNDKLNIKEIKSTSELGIMLDTERPWVELPREINTPNHYECVEVRLKDGTITIGWYRQAKTNWYVSDGSEDEVEWPLEDENNPVVAWREIVTDNK